MLHYREILESHPLATVVSSKEATECVRACHDCEVACSACADACLSEPDVNSLIDCIRVNWDCSEICGTVARVLSRRGSASADLDSLIHAALDVTRRCEKECRHHASSHEHCRLCAEACHACVDKCDRLLTRPLAASG